jgi:hypothetical protein
MLVVLDPGFFRENGITSTDQDIRGDATRRLQARLDEANRLLTAPNTALVVAADALSWFDAIYLLEARSIERIADRPLRQSLDRLREHRRRGRTVPGIVVKGKMWGIQMMAGWPSLGRSWLADLEKILGATVVEAARMNVPVVFLCHRIFGRNVRDCSAVGVDLVEVLRWRLSASISGAPPTVVPCASRLRHVEVPWTVRMDDRLPDQHGPGLHPYCPPNQWRNSKTIVWEVHQSRPCWLDAQQQYWARPSTGGGYHWDVWLNLAESARIGLSQINITQDDAPGNEGRPGDLHHVPSAKRQALRRTSGWRCPT